VVVAPTALHIPLVQQSLKRPDVSISAQNLWKDKAGAWTGELTADMIKDAGLEWVILGHSERRSVVAAETSVLVGEKVGHALASNLSVIACVGEKLEDRKAGQTMDVVVEQLMPIIAACKTKEAWKKIVIAYEPVWAIGTGVVATPQQAEETHANIRAYLRGKVSDEIADTTKIIYGGSVTAANCIELIRSPNIDGFLVGGASLKFPDFKDIIASAEQKQSKM
jgi:triosephosphate isomerase